MQELKTDLPNVKLVKPDVERDAPLGVTWLEGEDGRKTLRLMGVTEVNNKPSDLETERKRIQGLARSLAWMIELDDKVVGAIWIDLEDTEYLSSPAVHLMIGDVRVRGKGTGSAALRAVIGYQGQLNKYEYLYSRYITLNKGSATLLERLGFEKLGSIYKDKDGLEWQNVRLDLSS
ncbi:MAG TPA: GNAT family N-acetyltransferase [Candidatus Saccharimonadales bacterium]|nr:GNAT family N-acetyltransferase [Candidatus Saccharimonadales bacterium]